MRYGEGVMQGGESNGGRWLDYLVSRSQNLVKAHLAYPQCPKSTKIDHEDIFLCIHRMYDLVAATMWH